ncbi:PREDICTED: semaphorin-4D isoform X3 [Gekko japonicus]|uniref:Semaphorin-4D isoform X3 n=1 Tax=Gekko japonicus TaxID=146911 RepID=A0ABM1JT08_GEKJA|nr:PREDICTED: semaphorin-4D isoform X3 [Gekko japonicus]
MAVILYGTVSLFIGMTIAFGPVPRITWDHKEIHLVHFQEPKTFNYSTLLLSEDKDILYVGAREIIFALSSLNISEKKQEVLWKVTEDKKTKCAEKGKSKQTECLNYVRVLQQLNDTFLYVCGTNAFQPVCDYLNLLSFELGGRNEDGKGRCPFDPAQSYTSVMVDGELYAGTSYNFLGSEPIIFRNSQQSPLRTEYAIPWLNEPNFIFADVIRADPDNANDDDDKIYFFFTEVSVEYEFLGKLMIPRIARVCKRDQGGLRTLQKKWTSYLKARMLCSAPDKNLIFNIVNDVFILKSPSLREPVIYGVFSPQLNNVGLSAVCAYNISTVEDVFAKGKYMQSATVEQSHTKWVRYNGEIPRPRPGACINKEAGADGYLSTLSLPDKTLQFVKDHPLMDDSVTPIGDRPRLIKRDVKYTQIVVDRVRALNGTMYDVMFISTDRGALHKAISYENGMHIIEEIQLFPNFEPIQTLLLSSKKGNQFLYAGSNAGVVQSPLAFCDKYSTCVDCVLARDPYCAWDPQESVCVSLGDSETERDWIQNIGGDASSCPASSHIAFPPPGTSFLPCVGSDSAPSPINPQFGTDCSTVMLMPPFLSDQIWHVNAHSTFLLFCQAMGPRDARFVWKKNGQNIAGVNEQSHALADGRMHLLSWLTDAVAEDSEYCCLVLSKAGNRRSKVVISVEGKLQQRQGVRSKDRARKDWEHSEG